MNPALSCTSTSKHFANAIVIGFWADPCIAQSWSAVSTPHRHTIQSSLTKFLERLLRRLVVIACFVFFGPQLVANPSQQLLVLLVAVHVVESLATGIAAASCPLAQISARDIVQQRLERCLVLFHHLRTVELAQGIGIDFLAVRVGKQLAIVLVHGLVFAICAAQVHELVFLDLCLLFNKLGARLVRLHGLSENRLDRCAEN
ncbi:hypothetical protein BC831DRAFT_17180 [Entophlyctis helioformis]|nr:hypothetical protein BC831DRAFT_17180 [Entophlyctis helioformis]